MNLQQRIQAFVQLGQEIQALHAGQPQTEAGRHLLERLPALSQGNGWFSMINIQARLAGLAQNLREEELVRWVSGYTIPENTSPKTIGVILAGNIPLVGFDDFLAILITGNRFLGKLASDDTVLPVAIAEILKTIEPAFSDYIRFSSDRLADFDAVIATGSGNSARYFDHYFGKYPHIIRANRTGIAVLDGTETNEELHALGEDMFRYFGLGCRNVSKLYVPEGYVFNRFFENLVSYGEELMQSKKYMNNYEYHRTLYLMNSTALLDNNFMLLKEDEHLASPVGVIFYEYYASPEQLHKKITGLTDQIQAIIGHSSLVSGALPFGTAQQPRCSDYADGVDTLKFLLNLV